MTRHFLGLYLLIVLALAATSWGQDQLVQRYGRGDPADDKFVALALSALEARLTGRPVSEWPRLVGGMAGDSKVDMDLMKLGDIAGGPIVDKLREGSVAYMHTSNGDTWALKQLSADYVIALKGVDAEPRRTLLEWALTVLLYAAIALVIMAWIWPLTRDLRALEKATALYGNRNWRFEARIGPRSQVYSLAATFRAMATRIDGLIASHKDMFNAVAHEIKTPLSRMHFEIELAQRASAPAEVDARWGNIKADIAAIDDLVTAALEYAILERAEIALNLGTHNFSALIPAIVAHVQGDAHAGIRIGADVRGDAGAVVCDSHLFESVLRNLLYNALRYARDQVQVGFTAGADGYELVVEDDGPGIAEKDRARVFESFVQLDRRSGQKRGFGLGLAIVKRIVEWHRGEVAVGESALGGAQFTVTWPARSARP